MSWSPPSWSRPTEAAVLAALLVVSVSLLTLNAPAAAGHTATLPLYTTGKVVNITLYGDANYGWGYGPDNITQPGPHLYVQYGDTVQLTLIANDTSKHNWFIDYTNASTPVTGDPSSPMFGPGNSIVWPFIADRTGTWVYRCEIHPSLMSGFITISAPTHYTLYGDAGLGWGFTSDNLTNPGPTLVIEAGINVTLTLYAVDGTFHTWFIDYQNATSVSPGDPESPYFGSHYSTSIPNPLNWTFKATRAGTFMYRCGVHLTTMTGVVVVLGTTTGPSSGGLGIGLIPGIMVIVIVGVLVLAAVYQIRATRPYRMKK